MIIPIVAAVVEAPAISAAAVATGAYVGTAAVAGYAVAKVYGGQIYDGVGNAYTGAKNFVYGTSEAPAAAAAAAAPAAPAVATSSAAPYTTYSEPADPGPTTSQSVQGGTDPTTLPANHDVQGTCSRWIRSGTRAPSIGSSAFCARFSMASAIASSTTRPAKTSVAATRRRPVHFTSAG